MWADAELAKVWLVTPLPWATGCEGASVNFRAAVHLAQSRLLRPPDSKLRMMLAGPPRDWFGDLSGCGLQAGGGNKSASKRLILLAPKLIRGGREGGGHVSLKWTRLVQRGSKTAELNQQRAAWFKAAIHPAAPLKNGRWQFILPVTVCRSRSLLLLSIAWRRWSAARRHQRLVFHSAEQDGPRTQGVQTLPAPHGLSSPLPWDLTCSCMIRNPWNHLPTSCALAGLPASTSGALGFLLFLGSCGTKPSSSGGSQPELWTWMQRS